MKKIFTTKKAKIMAGLVAGAAVVGIGAFALFSNKSTETADAVYVTSVATLTGKLENGMRNRYAGVVESEESWSEENKSGKEVKEFNVNVGDAVTAGQQVLVYDTSEAEESLMGARVDLQRLNDELASLNENLNELNTEKNEAADESVATELTLEIQQQKLDIQSKNYDIQSKQNEINKLQQTVDNAVVTSGIDGVVKSVYNGETEGDSTKLITVVNTSKFQIKGRVNELNLNQIYEEMPVIVFSRVNDDISWKGTITKVVTDAASNKNESAEGGSDNITESSDYPFYVSLESNDGLIMGQHVYIEEDVGQLESDPSSIELEEYLIVDADKDAPYVWADNGSGRLEKRKVTLGDYNEETMKYKIKKGLKLKDKIAMPEEGLKEGQKTTGAESTGESEEEDTTETTDTIGEQ